MPWGGGSLLYLWACGCTWPPARGAERLAQQPCLQQSQPESIPALSPLPSYLPREPFLAKSCPQILVSGSASGEPTVKSFDKDYYEKQHTSALPTFTPGSLQFRLQKQTFYVPLSFFFFFLVCLFTSPNHIFTVSLACHPWSAWWLP